MHNPYAKGYSSGGSSSGCGALVANGDVDMGIGADQGGSIRVVSIPLFLLEFLQLNNLSANSQQVGVDFTDSKQPLAWFPSRAVARTNLRMTMLVQ